MISRLILFLQITFAVGGFYFEFAPSTWPLVAGSTLPKGMGFAIGSISLVMTLVLVELERERTSREELAKAFKESLHAYSRASICIPFHDSEFYSIWNQQVQIAQKNVDVTHLGLNPPRTRRGNSEKEYFESLKATVQKSSAHFRRVERNTPEKKDWIRRLCIDFENVPNFSLCLYSDPAGEEMPYGFSVCRIDDTCAWIVAISEHEATSNYRDLMIRGSENVELFRQYFEKRLWNRGVVVLDHGQLKTGWEQELKNA